MQELVLYKGARLQPLVKEAKVVSIKKIAGNDFNKLPEQSPLIQPATSIGVKTQIKILDPVLRPKKHECL